MNLDAVLAADLAKLVLGYLAEEQLMTAYDEFLISSPYLDSHHEYDRIFMTSLKSILAEYRAVKIYVESCKPYSLRRRLFGCPNLLEVVKFLIQNVDISKIQSSQDVSRGSLDPRNAMEKSNACAVCGSLNSSTCACKSRQSTTSHLSKLGETSAMESSVETTSLADLPGNHGTIRKKQVRVLLEDSKVSQSATSRNIDDDDCLGADHSDLTLVHDAENSHVRSNLDAQSAKTCTTTVHATRMSEREPLVTCNNRIIPHRLATAGNFQDFSQGVDNHTIVPDSSTIESTNLQTPKESGASGPSNLKQVPKSHVFLTVGTVKSSVNSTNSENDCYTPDSIRPKVDQKVTILSDVKVDKSFPPESCMPPVLKNATSTPYVRMSTILLNGRPIYKQPQSVNRTFTKDEIMAMPTIIVVTTSGSSNVPGNVRPKTTLCQTTNPPIVTSCAPSLEPLIIDVPSDPLEQNKESDGVAISQQHEKHQGMLVKTVDLKNASVPKDCGDVSNKTTPQVQPPVRKSSSTPRRVSHVRVLDFTTPRRILQETIAEQGESTKTSVEVIVSRSPNLHTLADPNEVDDDIAKASDKLNKASKNNDSGSSKENDNSIHPTGTKRNNWDADLRALAITNRKEDIPKSRIQPRCRPRVKPNKNKTPTTEKKEIEKSNSKEKPIPQKKRATKSKRKSEEIIEDIIEVPMVGAETAPAIPIKPTINIIPGSDWNPQQEIEKTQNKSNNEETADTPEMDRISLQNAIGVKLNISDLLETPYKQALYDIQMETPKFLGPDLPGEPLSDIKIMNIPTPRFLNNTPKPVQPTPSSYSSRPTDYSSGGSYYKPDDQDYLSAADLGYPASTSQDKESGPPVTDTPVSAEKKSKNKSSKSSRPVRSCAKNVSYYKSTSNQKSKGLGDKSESVSLCSETGHFVIIEKTAKETKAKTPKSGVKKKNSEPKKRKTPVKKDKTFIKIKPRRVTPIKKRTYEGPGRRRTISKDKSGNESPSVIPAPTKSRRKSSTPRKLHCNKNFNTEKYGNESPEVISNQNQTEKKICPGQTESDTEHLPLQWSDDGSQDTKALEIEVQDPCKSKNYDEDISTIKQYLASASNLHDSAAKPNSNDGLSNLHDNLVKRGFDVETAKIIERDLLDTPPEFKENYVATKVISETLRIEKDITVPEKSIESDTSCNLKIVQEDEEEETDEIEFSVAECTEDSANYIQCNHDNTKDMPIGPFAKLKDKFSMEVCIDDGVVMRLRATPFSVLLDEDPQCIDVEEIQSAVNSISNIDRLYTPMKESLRAQVYDIFDSTLTSLDTPLKATSPKRKECDTTVTEIVLEVEEISDKERSETERNKRKRKMSNESDAPSESKKTKPEAQYLLNSANIQNIDIETVLSKLHGP